MNDLQGKVSNFRTAISPQGVPIQSKSSIRLPILDLCKLPAPSFSTDLVLCQAQGRTAMENNEQNRSKENRFLIEDNDSNDNDDVSSSSIHYIAEEEYSSPSKIRSSSEKDRKEGYIHIGYQVTNVTPKSGDLTYEDYNNGEGIKKSQRPMSLFRKIRASSPDKAVKKKINYCYSRRAERSFLNGSETETDSSDDDDEIFPILTETMKSFTAKELKSTREKLMSPSTSPKKRKVHATFISEGEGTDGSSCNSCSENDNTATVISKFRRRFEKIAKNEKALQCNNEKNNNRELRSHPFHKHIF